MFHRKSRVHPGLGDFFPGFFTGEMLVKDPT